MSRPAVVFADPEARARSLLIADMTGRPEAYATTSITTSFPTTALTGNGTHLQVELEAADSTDYPVRERAQVRVTAYAPKGKRDNVKNLASLAQGLFLSHDGVFPQTGRSDVITDPDTQNLMCWFLVRVDLLASVLAS